MSSVIYNSQIAQMQIEGSIDFSSIMSLRKCGEKILRQIDCKEITLDLSKVTYCSSATMVLIFTLQRCAKSLGKSIRLQHVPNTLQRIADVCGVHQLINERE